MKFKIFTVLVLLCVLGCPLYIYSQSSIIDTEWSLANVDTSVTRSIDFSTLPGIFQLETGERENLARGRFAYLVYQAGIPTDTSRTRGQRVIDGILSTFIEIPSQTIAGNNNGSYIIIDLQAFRTIKRVEIQTFANNPLTRPIAFTVFAGEDTITMDKVYENLNNELARPIAEFNPIIARYVRIVFDIVSQANSTVISEIEVYGEGFLPEGVLVSAVKDAGQSVNFGTFEFAGIVPNGTQAEFGFRTGDTPLVDSTWSIWSDYSPISNSLFVVNEPRRYIQYRARLTTINLFSPEIEIVQINYDSLNVVSNSEAAVNPQIATILREQEFTLTINLQFEAGDRGLDTLHILTPSPIELLDVTVNNAPVAFLPRADANSITFAFNATIISNSQIAIRFRTTPFLGVSPFTMTASSKEVANNPQKIDSPTENNVEGWSIITTGVPERLIISARAEPNPFTPNNDGINDFTELKFFLGNVGEPNSLIGQHVRTLTINIFDLTGRKIKELFNSQTRSFAFISSNAIQWDGRDEHGNIVRPGVYVYQIFVDTDNGGEYETKTIVVSY